MESSLFRIDNDRYQSMRLIAWWSQSTLAQSKVLVVGAGALGNEVLKNLMLLGVGNILVVDRDRIEMSNLNRAVLFQSNHVGAYKAEVAASQIRTWNPDIKIEPIVGDVLYDIGLGTIASCDLVLGCVDNREARLWINQCCRRTSRPWIDAGLRELSGVVQPFHPQHGACYECGMKETDYQALAAVQSCHGVGLASETTGRIPTSPTVSSLIAGLQTQWAIKYLHGRDVPWGTATVWNGDTDQFYRSELPFREDCLSHERWNVTTKIPDSFEHGPLSNIFRWLSDQSATQPLAQPSNWYLLIDRPMWQGWRCGQCRSDSSFDFPQRRLQATDSPCPKCNAMRQGIPLNRIEIGSRFAHLPLASLGIPTNDWLRFYQCDPSTGQFSRQQTVGFDHHDPLIAS